MSKIALIVCVVLLVGCSSAPKKSRLVSDQYCHTSQIIETQDKQNVSSRTVVKCSDDPVDKYIPVRMGLAANCQTIYTDINLGGRLVRERHEVCQKNSGEHVIIQSRSIRR